LVKDALANQYNKDKNIPHVCYACGSDKSYNWHLNRDQDKNVLCDRCKLYYCRPRKFATKKERHDNLRKILSPRFSGEGNPYYGRKHTEEILQKISDKKRGRPSWNKGIPCSEQTRKKLREFNLGNRHTEACKAKIAAASKKMWETRDRRILEEVRLKISNARMKQVFPLRDSSIEVLLQNALRVKGVDFEKHKPIFGQPDIFIPPNLCIFADGEYWHRTPKKVERDSVVNITLQLMGYKVLRFWESDIHKKLDWCISQIISSV
jgi:G:T-mismatch repair DNA endonuclease (very short patch repair protein)